MAIWVSRSFGILNSQRSPICILLCRSVSDISPSTYRPVQNTWAWNNLTNIVWVEQPIGTGFTQGNVTATNEEDIAKDFMGFFKNFVDTFAMQGYTVYIAGESYAGEWFSNPLEFSDKIRLLCTIFC